MAGELGNPRQMLDMAQALAARYNGARVQRERILDCLRRAGAAGVMSSDLAHRCMAPCITKRVSELRHQGHDIRTCFVAVSASDGSVNSLALYVLTEGAADQGELFK